MKRKKLLKNIYATRLGKIILVFSTIIILILYALIPGLKYSDEATIKKAKEVDDFISKYCDINNKLPNSKALRDQFPNLNIESGWFFYTDDSTYLKVEYPVRWSNDDAIGQKLVSEFTGTVYAYIIEYDCKINK